MIHHNINKRNRVLFLDGVPDNVLSNSDARAKSEQFNGVVVFANPIKNTNHANIYLNGDLYTKVCEVNTNTDTFFSQGQLTQLYRNDDTHKIEYHTSYIYPEKCSLTLPSNSEYNTPTATLQFGITGVNDYELKHNVKFTWGLSYSYYASLTNITDNFAVLTPTGKCEAGVSNVVAYVNADYNGQHFFAYSFIDINYDYPEIESVEIEYKKISLYTNDTAQLYAITSPYNIKNKEVIWTIDEQQNSKATIDANGIINTHENAGSLTVRCTSLSNNNIYSTVKVYIVDSTAELYSISNKKYTNIMQQMIDNRIVNTYLFKQPVTFFIDTQNNLSFSAPSLSNKKSEVKVETD